MLAAQPLRVNEAMRMSLLGPRICAVPAPMPCCKRVIAKLHGVIPAFDHGKRGMRS